MAIIGSTKMKILKELEKNPIHGYALSKKLGITISSVYEHLSELEGEGLVKCVIDGRRKVYSLTEKGRKLLEILRQEK